MIAKLYLYFGVTGIASMAVWLSACVLLWVGQRSPRRFRFRLAAVIVALVAFVLGLVNSANVASIRLDRREEIAAAMKLSKAMREAQREEGQVSETLRFAEDAPGEEMGPEAGAAHPPSYRDGGVQARTAGKRKATSNAAEESGEDQAPQVKVLKLDDWRMANRLDRGNLILIELVLFAALFLTIKEYLRRLNTTFDAVWPLPVAGVWLDALFPKTRSVLLAHPSSMLVDRFLARTVRKGETFLYFGERDGCPHSGLTRFGINTRRWWRLPSLEWALPKFVYGSDPAPCDMEFLFDAVWFSRYAVVVKGTLRAETVLRALIPYLAARCSLGASARRTVNLVWDLPDLPPPELLRPLLRMSRSVNFKIVVACVEPSPALADGFDEKAVSPARWSDTPC